MFKIDSGEFRDFITFKRLQKSNSSLEDDKYIEFYSCRAKAKGIGGNEFLKADNVNLKTTYNFIIRNNRALEILNTDIIVFKNKVFDITYINDSDVDYVEIKGVEE